MAKSLIGLSLISLFSGNAEANQDPTAPLGWKHIAASASEKRSVTPHRLPNLNSIICRQSYQCIAILNDKVVEQGARIDGYSVTKVNREFVTLKRGHQQWKLQLFSLNIKK